MTRLINNCLSRIGLQLSWLQKPGDLVGPLRIGKFEIKTDNTTLLRSYREYPENNAVIGRIVDLISHDGRNPSMIDIGANCGDSLAIAKQAFDVDVLCVEGDESLLAQLRDNAAQFAGVSIANSYVADRKAEINVAVEKRGWNSTLAARGGKINTVALETLDSVVASWNALPQLRFVKCDVEGYDVRALLGAVRTLGSKRPIVLFEYNREAMKIVDEPGLRVFDYLKDLGYQDLLFFDAFGRFILTCTVDQCDLIRDLHDYADGRTCGVYYYDVVAFSKAEASLAKKFIDSERQHRRAGTLDTVNEEREVSSPSRPE